MKRTRKTYEYNIEWKAMVAAKQHSVWSTVFAKAVDLLNQSKSIIGSWTVAIDDAVLFSQHRSVFTTALRDAFEQCDPDFNIELTLDSPVYELYDYYGWPRCGSNTDCASKDDSECVLFFNVATGHTYCKECCRRYKTAVNPCDFQYEFITYLKEHAESLKARQINHRTINYWRHCIISHPGLGNNEYKFKTNDCRINIRFNVEKGWITEVHNNFSALKPVNGVYVGAVNRYGEMVYEVTGFHSQSELFDFLCFNKFTILPYDGSVCNCEDFCWRR